MNPKIEFCNCVNQCLTCGTCCAVGCDCASGPMISTTGIFPSELDKITQPINLENPEDPEWVDAWDALEYACGLVNGSQYDKTAAMHAVYAAALRLLTLNKE